ncbi:MAG: hypothetical protein ABI398_10625 [Devosia sp.]
MIEIVTATRLTAAAFQARAPLGQSLKRLAKDPRLKPHIAYENNRGLSEIYNARIDATTSDILVFVHDDVWLEDFYFADRIVEGLKQFDIIGVAGNSRRVAGQDAWARVPGADRLDLPYLRGAIAHGDAPLGKVGFYGPIIGECALLDGVFIAARTSALKERGARFDPRFAFHFYDLDFCRTVRDAGLRLSTWPIAMTHRSAGDPTSPSWTAAREAYFAKWGD